MGDRARACATRVPAADTAAPARIAGCTTRLAGRVKPRNASLEPLLIALIMGVRMNVPPMVKGNASISSIVTNTLATMVFSPRLSLNLFTGFLIILAFLYGF